MGSLAPNDAVKGCYALLTIQQEFNVSRLEGRVAARVDILRPGHPCKQAADRVPTIERLHQLPNLVLFQVPSLKDRKGNGPVIDLVQDGANLHVNS